LIGSGRGLTLMYYPGIHLGELQKITKTLIRIAVAGAENRTRDLPNTKQDSYPLW